MSLFVEDGSGRPVPFEVRDVVLAGYTGRDQEGVRRHVEELAAHGVPAPATVPAFYRGTPDLVRATDAISVLGASTSGEAEFVLLQTDGERFVGVGSDHTDRALERDSVTFAKQLCPKVVAREVWRLADVLPHWDRLVLRAFHGPGRELYQEGPVTDMLDPEDIFARSLARAGVGPDGVLVFSGTLPLAGELTFADRFAVELVDEHAGRRLALDYTIDAVEPLD
ncbi:MAG TPA: DUF2848 family protein [Solirubrobacter sp.]|nr:DUF2848 family protein [Solirubrobacter sp.]